MLTFRCHSGPCRLELNSLKTVFLSRRKSPASCSRQATVLENRCIDGNHRLSAFALLHACDRFRMLGACQREFKPWLLLSLLMCWSFFVARRAHSQSRPATRTYAMCKSDPSAVKFRLLHACDSFRMVGTAEDSAGQRLLLPLLIRWSCLLFGFLSQDRVPG